MVNFIMSIFQISLSSIFIVDSEYLFFNVFQRLAKTSMQSLIDNPIKYICWNYLVLPINKFCKFFHHRFFIRFFTPLYSSN